MSLALICKVNLKEPVFRPHWLAKICRSLPRVGILCVICCDSGKVTLDCSPAVHATQWGHGIIIQHSVIFNKPTCLPPAVVEWLIMSTSSVIKLLLDLFNVSHLSQFYLQAAA